MRKAMFRIRRYATTILLGCLLGFVLFCMREYTTRTDQRHVIDIPSQSIGVTPSTETPIKWDQLPTHFPIAAEALLPLPAGDVRSLPLLQATASEETVAQVSQRRKRQTAVRDAFLRCWNEYRERAWTHDELLPLSREHVDKYGGWGATLVENLDTLWIMDLKDEFAEALDAVAKFDTGIIKNDIIYVKRVTIRHLAGLLAAYDLSDDTRLLDKAREFGEMLLKPFDTPNHLPIVRWDWRAATGMSPQILSLNTTLLAEIGSLSMEFTRLSQLTGDLRWFSATHNLTLLFESQIHDTLLPGMFPVHVGTKLGLDVRSNNVFTVNGWADSFYEYIPKMHLLLGGLEPVYEHLYKVTMDAVVKHTLFRPMTRHGEDILFPGTATVTQHGTELTPNVQHVGCFAGGMFLLGGKMFNDSSHQEIGRKLVDACVWAYTSSPSGIMAERFEMVPCADLDRCEWNETRYQNYITRTADNLGLDTYSKSATPREGITWFEDTKFRLRPEAIESLFIAYRLTGDASLQDLAWRMFNSIMNMTTTEYANAAFLDVTVSAKGAGRNQQFDSMESFWLTETLKYFYLMFSDMDHISLDEFVFNTEGHPLRRPIPTQRPPR